jgi:hypothetical protein
MDNVTYSLGRPPVCGIVSKPAVIQRSLCSRRRVISARMCRCRGRAMESAFVDRRDIWLAPRRVRHAHSGRRPSTRPRQHSRPMDADGVCLQMNRAVRCACAVPGPGEMPGIHERQPRAVWSRDGEAILSQRRPDWPSRSARRRSSMRVGPGCCLPDRCADDRLTGSTDVSPDGKRFVMLNWVRRSYNHPDEHRPQLVRELKARLPTK